MPDCDHRLFSVSIHALTRSATLPTRFCRLSGSWFQSTHSRGVRLSTSFSMPPSRCFNPRTHEECDGTSQIPHPYNRVSIHALTRSATPVLASRWLSWRVSIHALTRSATHSAKRAGSMNRFQSTHSRGVRQLLARWLLADRCFNPRTHEECDIVDDIDDAEICKFQSTHSRGVRHDPLEKRDRQRSFNPRTHEECDTIRPVCLQLTAGVSIHALTRSAT